MSRGMVVALVGFCACSGDGAKDSGDTGSPSGPSFTRIKAEILTPSCALAGCHAAGGAVNNGMELVEGNEHPALVDAESLFKTGAILVIPNDSDGSYVVQKLEDQDDIVGFFMPYGPFPLEAEYIQLMRDWIDAGALDN